MDEQQRSLYEKQSKELRAELKRWELNWTKQHGQKPGQSDIKQNPDIAKKYKSYNKCREILSGKIPPPSSDRKSNTSKPTSSQSHDGSAARTPSKRLRPTTTPIKSRHSPREAQGAPTPSPGVAATPSISRKLFSPAVPTSIGPTPQRDGRVLGLFDILTGSDAETPSRPRTTAGLETNNGKAGHGVNHIQSTPRKRSAADIMGLSDDESEDGRCRPKRTPMSSSKRRLLNSFSTPLKDRSGNAGAAAAAATTPQAPGSASSATQFATPSFLKRGGCASRFGAFSSAPLSSVDENGEYALSPRPLRLPRKPLLRGLSDMVASLRKLEEEQLDDDLDALREMEMESGAVARETIPRTQQASQPKESDSGSIQSADQAKSVPSVIGTGKEQRPVLLGGFDDEAMYDEPPEEELNRDGQPLPVYRKKGQKRTTKLVKMKPTRSRRSLTGQKAVADVSSESDNDEVIPETQIGTGEKPEQEGLPDLGSGSEFDDFGSGEDEEKETSKKRSSKKGKAANSSKGAAQGVQKKEGTVKKAVRKVKATAHANFKRLKLRNSGAKGGPGYNSRFRRRR
ncbi:hypothetical protein VTK73DRAFT_9889 [Phialemonium thermophilum]|uniref:DNA replication regulator SLD2 n=1 Tax=Phialemonium thermophilum TaxID=223376 RepID=A0ABR3VZK9_9PEZI